MVTQQADGKAEIRRMYIDSQAEFEAFIERARQSEYLAIDTEFMREKTYYPVLCLIQMATEAEEVVIDPFALDDIKALAPLLLDENVMKIFHAGRQDIEIFVYYVGCAPRPLFDTQVAATVLGQAQQIGYAGLVHAVCGVKLKKSDSFTDWSVRPLSESQLSYAIEDVRYLPEIYKRLKSALEEKGRLGWLDADFREMANTETYLEDERERYRRLKHVGQLSRRQMAAAREVAAWREIEARSRNIPRKWVLTDEQIVEACRREARTIDELFMVRGMREKLTTRDARIVVALMAAALDSSPEAWPELAQPGRSERNVDAEADLLMAVVRIRAKEHGIAIPTLASHNDLVAIARGHRDVDLLKGWRRDIVGNDLVDIAEGRCSLAIVDGRVTIERA